MLCNHCVTSYFQWFKYSQKSYVTAGLYFFQVQNPQNLWTESRENHKASPASMSKTKKENASACKFQSTITNQFLSYRFPLKDWPRVEHLSRYNLHVESQMKIKALEILPRFGVAACTLLWWLLASDSFLNQRNPWHLPCSHCSLWRQGHCCVSAFALAFLFNFSFQWAGTVKQGS